MKKVKKLLNPSTENEGETETELIALIAAPSATATFALREYNFISLDLLAISNIGRVLLSIVNN